MRVRVKIVRVRAKVVMVRANGVRARVLLFGHVSCSRQSQWYIRSYTGVRHVIGLLLLYVT